MKRQRKNNMYDELTEIDIKKMREEIDYRTGVLRPQIRDMIIAAKELGDLSENAEYRSVRREKALNESRIAYLEDMIMSAKIIKTNPNKDVIGIFDKVEVLYEADNEIEKYTISTTLRRDAKNNIISNQSPLGNAIFGKKVGDRCFVDLGSGKGYYVVIKSIEKGEDDDT